MKPLLRKAHRINKDGILMTSCEEHLFERYPKAFPAQEQRTRQDNLRIAHASDCQTYDHVSFL